MEVSKIPAPPPPKDVPVATITVSQKELDFLTGLVNECATNSTGVNIMNIWSHLSNAGGKSHRFRYNHKKTFGSEAIVVSEA